MIPEEIIEAKSRDEFGAIISKKIIEILVNRIEESGECFFAVSGGSTPMPVYKNLINTRAENVVDWSKVHLFFIDERCVPRYDKKNNFKSCFDAWLTYFPEIKSHRIEGWNNPREAASNYENEIKSIIKKKNGIPQLDLIFMGMGEDGHVASIFPENEDHKSLDSLVEDIFVESKNMYRITMTMQILNNSKNRIIGILGDKKRMIFNDLLNSNYKNYPSAKLLSSNSNDTWILY